MANRYIMAAEKNIFEVLIKGYESYNLGDSISIQFHIKNITKQDYIFLPWNIPFQGIDNDQFRIIFEGKKISYDGIKIKRGNPTIQCYILLKAGETKQVSANLSKSYHLEKPGNYSITLISSIKDYFEPPIGNPNIVRRIKDFQELAIVSNEIQIKLVEDGKLVRIPVRIKLKQKESKSEFKEPQQPTFIGGSDELRAETIQAHFAAIQMCKLTREALGSVPDEHYIEMFGANDNATPSRFRKVCNNYDNLYQEMLAPIIYDFTDMNRPDVYAYTAYESEKIWLCDLFASSPITGIDSKAGTILHEYTHKILDTEDEAYGMVKGGILAMNKPDHAINNADNYEHFSETSVHGNQELYAFHRNYCSEMCASTLLGDKWSGDAKIDNVLMSFSPSVVLYKGKLYIFHNGHEKNSLWYFHGDGTNWSQDIKVPNVEMIARPEAVAYKNDMYVFFLSGSNELWYVTFDGTDWSNNFQKVSPLAKSPPSAIVFKDNLYVFYQGSNKKLRYIMYNDEDKWRRDRQIPEVLSMLFSPAAVIFQCKLFVFYNNNGMLEYCVFDGKFWEKQDIQVVAIIRSPSVCYYNFHLNCFYERDSNSGKLRVTKFDGEKWSDDNEMQNVKTKWTASLATAVFLDKLITKN